MIVTKFNMLQLVKDSIKRAGAWEKPDQRVTHFLPGRTGSEVNVWIPLIAYSGTVSENQSYLAIVFIHHNF
jgi:hypothetical protein